MRLRGVVMLSLIGLALAAGGVAVAKSELTQRFTIPLREAVITGEWRHLQEAHLREQLRSLAEDGFIAADMDEIKASIEAMPWVRQAAVRRVWPGRLQIEVFEQEPMVVWNQTGVLNRAGELFHPEIEEIPAGLARIEGPGSARLQAAGLYRELAAPLAAAGFTLQRMRISERMAVRLWLDNGWMLNLGRNAYGERVARLLQAQGTLRAEPFTQIESIDLRYTNGFALRMRTEETESKG